MTPQSTFMIVAPVRGGELQKLRALLAGMNKSVGLADPDNELLPFGAFERLHMARFVIVESITGDEIKAYGKQPRPWQPVLAFLGDIDGDRLAFFAELARKAEAGLQQIFAHCEGFTKAFDLLSWMLAHNIEPAANYVNWLGRTVKQVREEAALHRCLTEYLQQIVVESGRDNPRVLRQKLLSHVEMQKHAGLLKLSPEEPTPLAWRIRNGLHKIGIPLVLLLLSPVFLILAPFFALRLRLLERSDPELFIRPSREHIEALAYLEDRDVSNQFNVFGDIKPGLFRLLLFKLLMLLTDYVARHIYKRGFLTRIRSIHFARWVFMDNNRRAFFASNYDGSHESYMDDFINKAGWGLNLAFGNAVGYPTTRWLVKQGAEREQQFKYTQRRHQLPSQVWYKAYPDLTAVDLARNSRIRKGVEIRQADDQAIRDWLGEI
ncbi:hypothetical protein NP590_03440 [Methylomonas sp. SURF-2]|uniref:Uncharacterized protein n=1 Tax=Methylomonas subterranea TaxID=2952225 RepID=A0ABT1TCF7_9GAMM|nr:hypothetical protein [Methylomonas sp. SURF-2]MCQ8103151.1 hypothetical protein [Methylomonas sp. SURF-2]